MRRLAGRKDNAGRQDAERVEGLLQLAEQADDLFAVHPLEQSGPEPAVAVLARRRAAESNDGVRHLLQHPRHALLPSRLPDLRQQVHVHVAVSGVSEDHGGDVACRGHPAHDPDVLADPLQGHAAVLDHLQRAAVFRQAREDRARGVAQLPESGRAGRGQRGIHRSGPRPHALRRPSPRPRAGRAGRRARSPPAGWLRQRRDLRRSRCGGSGRGTSDRAARRPRARRRAARRPP